MDQNEQNVQRVHNDSPAPEKNMSALIWGLLSFFLSGLGSCFFGLPSFIMGIIAIVKAAKFKKKNGKWDGYSVIGMVGGILGLVFSVVGTVFALLTLLLGGFSTLLPFMVLEGLTEFGY